MAKYIIKRILAAIPMVLIITVICFALMNRRCEFFSVNSDLL